MENVNFIMFNIDELNEEVTNLYESMMDDENDNALCAIARIQGICKYLKSIYEEKNKQRG